MRLVSKLGILWVTTEDALEVLPFFSGIKGGLSTTGLGSEGCMYVRNPLLPFVFLYTRIERDCWAIYLSWGGRKTSKEEENGLCVPQASLGNIKLI